MTASDFDAISSYLITKPGLCESVMSIKRKEFKVLGYPVRIDSSQYSRNVFLFSVGFYIGNETDQEPYAQVLRKLGRFLDDAERTMHFISHSGESQPRENVHVLLRRIYVGLTQSGECVVPAIPGRFLSLKLLPTLPKPPPIDAEDVPIPIRDLEAIVGPDWDLCLRRITPFLDGSKYVRAIAELTDIPMEMVKCAIQQLLVYGMVKLIDTFQFSNVYAITGNLKQLLTDEDLQHACLDYVDPPKSSSQHQEGRSNQSRYLTLNINILFRLYASFGAGSRASDVFVNGKTAQYGLNEKRFITFGVVHELIRRLHHFPIKVNSRSGSDVEEDTDDPLVQALEEKDLLNGQWCVDHLCCISREPSRKLMSVLSSSKKYELILKPK